MRSGKHSPGMRQAHSEHDLIFISYRHSDSGWASAFLADRLKAAFGPDKVVLDQSDLRAGDKWASKLEDFVRRAAVLIVVIGRKWLQAKDNRGRQRIALEDDWPHREIRAGLNDPACLVVPVFVDGAQRPRSDDLPEDIRDLLNRQDITIHSDSLQQCIEKLVQELEAAGFARTAQRDKGLSLNKLTRPLKEIEDSLDSMIARLEFLQKAVGDCPNDEGQFYEYARDWHDLRKHAAVTIAQSFTQPDELLERLGKSVDFLSSEPSQQRRSSLIAQIQANLNFLRFLRACLPNYL